ncbi:MAG TPA: 16S rRNA (uracil(1498)-N(3))-methyltransferase [Oscillatoriales cyanobacterium M59_W2019_021]|nr:MAG: 16S rRNA (uracil(1498)-N(3))-methyltransferase [Cyanobacteria bacterium J055]HIK32744.1 16S rRNA (uracil(1498)-N(3))-methyltransferase [Oscillatoriales cyanobacterium M4454_W2019_049]HIK52483.1 16S rRNA (uracil(1498)-N(3))-methyltransferase [Oscillatoriales cyanobacterium M59_W2019_021]
MQFQRIAIDPSQFDPPSIALTPEQQHYLSRVLRLKSGDRFVAIVPGEQWWLSSLERQSSGEFSAIALDPLDVRTELPIAITLIAALPKGNGFDEVVRSCTELGVNTIQPISSDRTVLSPSPQKLERWRRIIREAAEQSERQTLPILNDPLPFTEAIARCHTLDRRYICLARGERPSLLQCLQTAEKGSLETIAIAVGPEGGWTPPEVERAIAAGFQPVSLGRRVLRAVTAPIVALSAIVAICE